MKSIGLVVLVAVVIFYSALGGVIFHYLENNNEQEAQVNIVRYIQEFQSEYSFFVIYIMIMNTAKFQLIVKIWRRLKTCRHNCEHRLVFYSIKFNS